jgi:hypothetical protein
MKIETIIVVVLAATVFNMCFTFWMTSDYNNIAQQHRAEQFLIEGMRCVETGLYTAGANEYAKVFDCGDN